MGDWIDRSDARVISDAIGKVHESFHAAYFESLETRTLRANLVATQEHLARALHLIDNPTPAEATR